MYSTLCMVEEPIYLFVTFRPRSNIIWFSSQNMIELKGMTFDHSFCYSFSFSSSLFFIGGKRKGERITKVMVKSHAFRLDHITYLTSNFSELCRYDYVPYIHSRCSMTRPSKHPQSKITIVYFHPVYCPVN